MNQYHSLVETSSKHTAFHEVHPTISIPKSDNCLLMPNTTRRPKFCSKALPCRGIL